MFRDKEFSEINIDYASVAYMYCSCIGLCSKVTEDSLIFDKIYFNYKITVHRANNNFRAYN